MFHGLTTHLSRPISETTGASVRNEDYTSMVDENGAAVWEIDMADMRQKLGQIAKRKAPGYVLW